MFTGVVYLAVRPEEVEDFYEAHRSSPRYAAWQKVAARCVVPGGHVNTFCTPLFPDAVMEMKH
jgi:(4S)-4-hydroxy-5-phosphonooxypentane-2,3-dione isomerase